MSAQPEVVVPVMDEDQVLDYTQQIRQQVVQQTLATANFIQDTKMTNTMLSALDGMDRNALGRKRIKVDEKATDVMAGSAGVVALMLRQSRDPQYLRGGHNPELGSSRAAPVLGDDLPDDQLVEGEMSQTPLQLTFDKFQSQFGTPTEKEGSTPQA